MESVKNINGKSSFSKRKLGILVLTSVLMFLFLTSISVAASRITIYDNDTVYSKYTVYTTVDEILADESIVLGEYDEYKFSGFEEVDGTDEATIEILRAFNVIIEVDSRVIELQMTEGTVQTALDKSQITLGENDLINVAETEILTEYTEIVIQRVEYETYTKQTDIDYETENPELWDVSDANVFVDVEGELGILETAYEDTLIDGEVVETELLSETVVLEPVNEVLDATKTVYIGSDRVEFNIDDVPVELDSNGIPVDYAYKVSGKASAYSALGRPTSLTPGAVAMDLSVYPRGTELYIVSSDGSYVYGYSVVRDTGTAVCNGTVLVDCFFNTYEESCQFGIKYVDVYVLN